MSAIYSIAPDKLSRLIGTAACPVLIDVWTGEDFEADPNFIPGAVPRSYADVGEWAPSRSEQTAVICKKGQKLSEGVAAWLRQAGASANVLEGVSRPGRKKIFRSFLPPKFQAVPRLWRPGSAGRPDGAGVGQRPQTKEQTREAIAICQ
jgi:hypothetical protein